MFVHNFDFSHFDQLLQNECECKYANIAVLLVKRKFALSTR